MTTISVLEERINNGFTAINQQIKALDEKLEIKLDSISRRIETLEECKKEQEIQYDQVIQDISTFKAQKEFITGGAFITSIAALIKSLFG